MASNVHTTFEGSLATVVLDRPDKLNAIDVGMLRDLEKVAIMIEERPAIRAVLLTGRGKRAFCVGADIHAWAALEPLDMWRQWIREGHRVLNRLAKLSPPLIAAINGYAFGGGLELALVADLRLAAEHATFAMPEVTIGTVPGWGGTVRLPDLIGSSRAKEMIFSGNRIDAQKAEQWGLVNHVVPAASLMDKAHALATRIADNAPLAVQMAKQLVHSRAHASSVTLEALAGALTATTDDGREGIESFRHRRPPQYQGT